MNSLSKTVMETTLTLSARELSARSRDLPESFWLKPAAPGEPTLLFTHLLRVLPGRRIVGRAEVEGKTVLAKLFLGRMTGRYAARERQGVAALAAAGVRTPELLFEHELDNGHVMAFEFLDDAQSLAEKWRLAPSAELLSEVVQVLAQMHDAGVVQNDIHLDNFLCSDEKIYCIDGGSVERKSVSPVEREASLRNLATFFAQFYPRFDAMIPRILHHYGERRGWRDPDEAGKELKTLVKTERERRKRIYINKAFRECTRYYCESDFNRLVICDRSEMTPDMQRVLDDPDQAMRTGTILKDGNTATVVRVETDRGPIVIKRYNIKDAAHRARRAVSTSRAWRSWSNAHLLEFLGIAALQPLALIEDRFGPLRSTAYFITAYVEGLDAKSYCDEAKPGCNQDDIVARMADVLSSLAHATVTHGDLKATNFLVTDDGLVLIDLDSMKEHQSQKSFGRAFARDLNRLLRNWEGNPQLAATLQQRLAPIASNLNISLG